MQPAVDAPLSVDGAGVDGAETKSTDPFDEIDLGEYFDQYLDPGFKSPALENVEKPSFETFLSSPVTLFRSFAFAACAGGVERAGARCGGSSNRKPE